MEPTTEGRKHPYPCTIIIWISSLRRKETPSRIPNVSPISATLRTTNFPLIPGGKTLDLAATTSCRIGNITREYNHKLWAVELYKDTYFPLKNICTKNIKIRPKITLNDTCTDQFLSRESSPNKDGLQSGIFHGPTICTSPSVSLLQCRGTVKLYI